MTGQAQKAQRLRFVNYVIVRRRRWRISTYSEQRTKERTNGLLYTVWGKTHANAPMFIDERFLNGERRSIATMPMLKICTPPPDMYSMNACMGSDLSGEMAKSQAFLVFRSSYEFSALALVVVTDDFPLLGILPYNVSIMMNEHSFGKNKIIFPRWSCSIWLPLGFFYRTYLGHFGKTWRRRKPAPSSTSPKRMRNGKV